MRIERMRNGLEVFNKTNGKMYKVISVDQNEGTACEMLEDDQLGEASVIITEDNALAFRIVKDPEPYPVASGYTVVDGILYKDGKKVCEQGQIRVEKIIAEMPGQLVCVEKSEKEDGRYVLLAYNPARDCFKVLNRKEIPMPELIGYTNDRTTAFLAFSVTDVQENTKGDGTKEKIHTFMEASVIVLNGERASFIKMTYPIIAKDAFLKEVNGHWSLFVPGAPILENGERINSSEYHWNLLNDNEEEYEMMLPENIRADWSYAYHDFVMRNDEALFVGTGGDMIIIENPVVKELADYPILIDITKEQWQYKLTFVNPETYKMKTLISRSTKDRGYIVTIE